MKKRRRLPLTPLIDVIFILVMFFLLSSTFGTWQILEVRLSGSAASSEDQAQLQKSETAGPAPILISLRSAPETGKIVHLVNGVPVAENDLLDELNRLAALGARTALILPTGQTGFQAVVDVLDKGRASDLDAVTLALD